MHHSIADIEMPPAIARLPQDHRGYPVPWFVAKIDGKYDFRVMKPNAIAMAVARQVCWICGEPLLSYVAYVIGPMCAVNRISAEPPSHLVCARYAVRACPFLTRPHMVRREQGLPSEAVSPPGTMVRRNPGATLIWVTDKIQALRVDHGLLFDVGEPIRTLWFSEGREATREEILESINSGLPLLEEAAALDGAKALEELGRMTERALRLVPA